MIVKIEPSGCSERKGMVQIRFSFYLEPGEHNYHKHYVKIPIVPPEGYPGEVYPNTHPKDMEHFQQWLKKLPKEWQNQPFHDHFIRVEPDTTDEEIMDIGEGFLQEAYDKWCRDVKRDLKNPKTKYPKLVDGERLTACEAKVQHLKTTILEKKPKWLK